MRTVLLLLCCIPYIVATGAEPGVRYVFRNGEDGYRVYRIPAIIATPSGKLLAFCEGRRTLRDHGKTDIVLKVSEDQGETWGPLKVIWSYAPNTCGNPSPVIERESGDVLVAATFNNQQVFILRSADDGENWETPLDITRDVKPATWQWYATGPVHAIQVEQGPYAGRIVVPANHTETTGSGHTSHILYSDDGGKTWRLGGSVPGKDTDESTVSETSGGGLLLNMRNNDKEQSCRKISRSPDGGLTWTPVLPDTTLIEPVCQGVLLRYAFDPGILLFSNPADTRKRRNLFLRISYDDGEHWTKQLNIHPGKAAYSDLVKLENGNVLCVFETGKLHPYSGIAVRVIDRSLIRE